MAAAFYTAILTMLKIRRRYRWFLVPSFIIYTISDMWLAYLYSSEADPQFIHIIKMIFLLQTIIVYLIIFEGSLWKIATAVMVCDFVAGFPFSALFGCEVTATGKVILEIAPDLPYIPYGVTLCTAAFFVEYVLLRKPLKKYSDGAVEKTLWVRILGTVFWLNIAFPLINAWYTYYARQKGRGLVHITSIVLVLVFFTGMYREFQLQKKQKRKYLLSQTALMEEYYENLKEQVRLTEMFQNELADVRDYLNKNVEKEAFFSVKEEKPETMYTGSSIVNKVLTNKVRSCEKEGIVLHIEAESTKLPEELDMVVVLYNVLDNAIDSCKQMPEDVRWINLYIKNVEEEFTLICKNPRTGEKVLASGRRTWKRDKRLHGTGMKIVRDIAKKYKGAVQYEEKDTEFICRLTLMCR